MEELVNAKYVISQAEGMSPIARCVLGLVATSLLEPAMQLDKTASGRNRRDACIALWNQAADAVGDYAGIRFLRDVVAVSEELSYDEEPEGPETYRIDFMTGMLYAFDTYLEDSDRNLNWCIQAVADSLTFLLGSLDNSGTELHLTENLSEVVSGLAGMEVVGPGLVKQLASSLESSREGIRRLIGE